MIIRLNNDKSASCTHMESGVQYVEDCLTCKHFKLNKNGAIDGKEPEHSNCFKCDFDTENFKGWVKK